jgi:hypothetical protein
MKICKYILILAALFAVVSCAPKVSKTITRSYPPLDYREDVLVLDIQTPVPNNAIEIGTIRIGDSGFSTDCGWNTVIEEAKTEARKAGGNAIKITEHKPPSMASTCHRIKALILYIDNVDEIDAFSKTNDEAADWDYALLHIYRFGGTGALVNYDVYLGNEVICRAKNNWKTTIETRTFGRNSIWASTESKAELPINIEPGREYYIRCGIDMGIMVGRPSLQLVDNKAGKVEFNTVKSKIETQ